MSNLLRASIAVVLLAVSLPQSSTAQKAAHSFIDQVKKKKGSVAMTLPGWLIRTGFNIASHSDDEIHEMEGLRDIVSGIKQLRFAVLEGGGRVPSSEIEKLVKLSKDVDGMEEYVRVKDDGQQVTVMVKENGDYITNLLILANGDEELAVVNVKTKISLTELEAASFSFNEERKANN